MLARSVIYRVFFEGPLQFLTTRLATAKGILLVSPELGRTPTPITSYRKVSEYGNLFTMLHVERAPASLFSRKAPIARSHVRGPRV